MFFLYLQINAKNHVGSGGPPDVPTSWGRASKNVYRAGKINSPCITPLYRPLYVNITIFRENFLLKTLMI